MNAAELKLQWDSSAILEHVDIRYCVSCKKLYFSLSNVNNELRGCFLTITTSNRKMFRPVDKRERMTRIRTFIRTSLHPSINANAHISNR